MQLAGARQRAHRCTGRVRVEVRQRQRLDALQLHARVHDDRVLVGSAHAHLDACQAAAHRTHAQTTAALVTARC